MEGAVTHTAGWAGRGRAPLSPGGLATGSLHRPSPEHAGLRTCPDSREEARTLCPGEAGASVGLPSTASGQRGPCPGPVPMGTTF